VEVVQQREARKQREDPLEEKIVRKIVSETDVAPTSD
jgi:hypothetical protein